MANGPGKVAEALGVDLRQNGESLGSSLIVYDAPPARRVARSGRVGCRAGTTCRCDSMCPGASMCHEAGPDGSRPGGPILHEKGRA